MVLFKEDNADNISEVEQWQNSSRKCDCGFKLVENRSQQNIDQHIEVPGQISISKPEYKHASLEVIVGAK
jgi:hypothetical protein